MDIEEAIATQLIQESPAFLFDAKTKQTIDFWWDTVNTEFDEHHIPLAVRPKVIQLGLDAEAEVRFPRRTYPASQNGLHQLYNDLREEFTPERNQWFEEVRTFKWLVPHGETTLQFISRFERLFITENPNPDYDFSEAARDFLMTLPARIVFLMGPIPYPQDPVQLIALAREVCMVPRVFEAADEPGPNDFDDVAVSSEEDPDEDPEEMNWSDVSDVTYQNE